MGGSPDDLSEVLWSRGGDATQELENELRRLSYVTQHFQRLRRVDSATSQILHLRHRRAAYEIGPNRIYFEYFFVK